MEILNWNISEDSENIRSGAIELRAKVAENMYMKYFQTEELAQRYIQAARSHWRLECIKKVELCFGKEISGNVIEIGAGSGFCSALMSKKVSVKNMYCLDYDEFSIKELVPLVCKNLKADSDKLKLVIGSYNKMKVDEGFFDFVISLGAVHHSENLRATFSESFRVLKPGGIMIAVEHCHPDSYLIQDQLRDDHAELPDDRVKRLYNEKSSVKAIDNSDHNYRISEFIAAAYHAGFNVLPYVFDEEGEPATDQIFFSPKPFNGYGVKAYFPYFTEDKSKPIFDNFLFILHKPEDNKIDPRFMNINEGIKRSKSGLFSKLFNKK